ncbi:MAG: tetraacyldisaccharide 4'-kinase [Planctomycetaceae bacterium]|nr:tetraacyldisaccharide 4'-kinase [Planctomycetaceae bacterium]
MNQNAFREIVSGKDRRRRAALLRPGLRVLSWGWAAIIRARNAGYDGGWLRVYDASGSKAKQSLTVAPNNGQRTEDRGQRTCTGQPPVPPVISVGNITTGGTGKTPLVVWLCNYLHGRGVKCAILTRGYKTCPGQVTDEPALLGKACPAAAVVVDHDRVAGARKAIEQHHAQALVLDDGFQHRRLRRDLDIVAVDATCPFGYGRMLPAGLLREPLCGLKRAGAVVITRFDQADEEQVKRLEQEIRRLAPRAAVAKAVHRHTHAVTAGSRRMTIEELRQRPVFAFCGIGNPKAFYDCLAQQAIRLTGTRTFDDHHPYTDGEMKDVFRQAAASGAEVILCTQKDWVKSALLAPAMKPVLAYMAMELEFVEGLEPLKTLVDETIEKSEIRNPKFETNTKS